jgi:ribosomal protein S18 acetylase RimI-like enzyme
LYVDPIPFASGTLLDETNFHLVADFTCARPGHPEDRYEQDVSRWLKDQGRGGAREAIRLGLVEVRLYLHTDGRVIGFGALGPETWVLADGKAVPLWLLHYFGVHTNFRHQPGVAREARYGRRILGGLVEEVERRGRVPFFGLYADPDNPAQELYKEFHFQPIDVWPDPTDGGRPWVRMLRKLTT